MSSSAPSHSEPEAASEMPRPLVSVILPVYNGERFLREAIDSVLGQSYRAIELVAVDDGSTDGSAAILDSYGDRLVVVRQSNGGVARARSAGVNASHGEFVAFLDQDDWWRIDKIAKQVALFQADPELDLVHTDLAHYDERRHAYVGRLNPMATPQVLTGHCYDLLLMENHIANGTVMVRRSAIDRVGGFDTTIAGNTVADYDLWLRLARQSKFAFLPEELTVFRLHVTQGTWKRRDMLTAELQILAKHVPLPARDASPALRGRFARAHEELGIAHLDARDRIQARRCFGQSLREERTLRRAALYAASLLPPGLTDLLRSAKSGGSRA